MEPNKNQISYYLFKNVFSIYYTKRIPTKDKRDEFPKHD